MGYEPFLLMQLGSLAGEMSLMEHHRLNGEADRRATESNKRAAKQAIPEGAMRVGPGTDALVWKICPDYKSEL
jgi:hypothetical protein